jgi:adenosylcobyric acid synthase
MANPLHNLMVLGTSSDAGKSLLCTALCRWFADKGFKVHPFKSQNMSLNAVVTPEGCEIGVAQNVQALAARQIPSHLHNPILLKPQAGHVSQIIVKGQVSDTLNAKKYYENKTHFANCALESFNELQKKSEIIILEGAGSPVELNIVDRDIANLFMARNANAKCILVVNIELGGFFASVYGTLELMPPADRKRIMGVVVNNFRGDPSSFIKELKSFESKIGVPILGVLPHIENLALDVEDSVSLTKFVTSSDKSKFQVRVIQLPHISNFNEFQVFENCKDISWAFTDNAEELENVDLIILPGTKTTLNDLAWLKEKGLDQALKKHVSAGKKLVGICGGFQMLGKSIKDPLALEDGNKTEAQGLGLFDMHTVFSNNKILDDVNCQLVGQSENLKAFELHMGTGSPQNAETWINNKGQAAGWKLDTVYGSYLHGLFENKNILENVFGSADWPDMHLLREATFDQLAQCIDKHLDMKFILNNLKIN